APNEKVLFALMIDPVSSRSVPAAVRVETPPVRIATPDPMLERLFVTKVEPETSERLLSETSWPSKETVEPVSSTSVPPVVKLEPVGRVKTPGDVFGSDVSAKGTPVVRVSVPRSVIRLLMLLYTVN